MAKLYFYYAAMNAGKSTTLLQSAYNYEERGMSTILFTPAVDTRYGTGKISSRIGLNKNAIVIDDQFDIYGYVEKKIKELPNLACVLVDEANFLSKQQVRMLCKVVDQLKLPVLAYGLRSDFRGEPFEGSLYLLIWADELIEIKTICYCGRKATMNVRIDANGNKVHDGDQVMMGGNESYIATCRKHYYAGGPYKEDSVN